MSFQKKLSIPFAVVIQNFNNILSWYNCFSTFKISWTCVCVLSHFSRVWLCDPVNCSPPGSSVHGIFQVRLLEWLSRPPPGDLPDPGIRPLSPASPALWWILYHLATREACHEHIWCLLHFSILTWSEVLLILHLLMSIFVPLAVKSMVS